MVEERSRERRANRLRSELKNSLGAPPDKRFIEALTDEGALEASLTKIESGTSRWDEVDSLRSRYWKLRADFWRDQPAAIRAEHSAEAEESSRAARYVAITFQAAAAADRLREVQEARDSYLDGGLLLDGEPAPPQLRDAKCLLDAIALLDKGFGWGAEHVREFVTYGRHPQRNRSQYLKKAEGIPNRIILDLDENATVEDAKAALLAAKSDPLAKNKGRALSMWTVRRSAFGREVHIGYTWDVAQAEWNARYPEDEYEFTDDASRRFQRDTRKAFESVYGVDLEWFGMDSRPLTDDERELQLKEDVDVEKLADLRPPDPITGERLPVLKGKARKVVEERLEATRRS